MKTKTERFKELLKEFKKKVHGPWFECENAEKMLEILASNSPFIGNEIPKSAGGKTEDSLSCEETLAKEDKDCKYCGKKHSNPLVDCRLYEKEETPQPTASQRDAGERTERIEITDDCDFDAFYTIADSGSAVLLPRLRYNGQIIGHIENNSKFFLEKRFTCEKSGAGWRFFKGGD